MRGESSGALCAAVDEIGQRQRVDLALGVVQAVLQRLRMRHRLRPRSASGAAISWRSARSEKKCTVG